MSLRYEIDRMANIMPLFGHFLLLFIPELFQAMGILILVAIYCGLLVGMGSSVVWASPIALFQSNPPIGYGFIAEILAAICGVLLTALIALFAWVVRDRIAWEARGRQIDINTKKLERLESDLKCLVTEKEHETVLEDLSKATDRIDKLYEKMGGKVERPLREK